MALVCFSFKMADVDKDEDCRENLELQVTEIEMLLSMFPNEEEFRLDDPTTLIDMKDFLAGKLKTSLPNRVDFYLKVESNYKVDGKSCSFDLFASISRSYPQSGAEIYVRSEVLSRELQKELNNDLQEHLSTLDPGELWILPALQWLQDSTSECVTKSRNSNLHDNKKTEQLDQQQKGSFVRMWMYMHHIYSKTKRRIILDWSGDYNLTGFSLPGKPGVVCIEGEECNVEEYYSRLRRLNWKKITCRHRELGSPGMSIDQLRKFEGFHELSFEIHGTRENHMDMGQFFHFLEKHNLGEMFQVLFGIEGK